MDETTEPYTTSDLAKDVATEALKGVASVAAAYVALSVAGYLTVKYQDRKAAKLAKKETEND